MDFNKVPGDKVDGNYTRILHAVLRNSTLQKSSCTATYLPSYKPTKKDKQDMLGTADKIRTNS